MTENSFANAVKRAPAPPPATLDDEPQQQPKRKVGRPKKAAAVTSGSEAKEISARIDATAARQLKVLAAMHDTSIQALMAEAIAWIFRKYEKSEPVTDMDSETRNG